MSTDSEALARAIVERCRKGIGVAPAERPLDQ